MVESLIAILVLSAGVVLYAKNWSANFSATNSTHVRAIAAMQVAEIGNVLLANISDLGRDASRSQISARVQQFGANLQEHINSFGPAMGYRCTDQGPVPVNRVEDISHLNNATLVRTWSQGAASCVRITLLPNIATNTNGVWVKIETQWIDAHTLEGQLESVAVHTLVSPL